MNHFTIVAMQRAFQQRAEELAAQIGHAVLADIDGVAQGQWYLAVGPNGLSLAQAGKSSANGVQSAFHNNLPTSRASNTELLLKALGFPKSAGLTIVDASAGLGSDAAVIATRAQKLILIERSKIIAALLREGLQMHTRLAARLGLYEGDAIELLAQLAAEQRLDIIYLDPMFHFVSPANGKGRAKKTALPKKPAQSLQAIVGADDDQGELLAAALAVATRRVVVKRPRIASAIDGPVPDYSVTGKQLRYDVYLRAGLGT